MLRTHLPLSGALALALLGYGGDALAVDCFIDSVGGNDANSGLSEEQAVKSQAKIPKTCTVAKFKRGSQFAEALATSGSVKTFTNYGERCDPLPRFVMPGTTNTGAVLSAYQGGITVDGLYLANSHGDGSSSASNFGKGTCVMLGSNSVMQNCEITSCDIGVMLNGTGSKFLNNYVHDLNTMIADAAQSSGVNINTVGGAEAIFINGSNNEVAYNQFINCTGKSEWTGGSCDGGATEVSIGNNSTVSGVKVHHNFAYNTCGFFEVSSGTQGGTFADSFFYNNVSVDSGWMFLLQINNTKLKNVRWENNTIIYHKSADSSYAPIVSMIYNGTGTSGVGNAVMGSVDPETVFFNNNLVLFEGFGSPSKLDENISQKNNLITATTAGVVKSLGQAGTQPSPSDFDLIEGSPAIDGGLEMANVTLDFLNRAIPAGGAPDIGAFEYGAAVAGTNATPVSTLDIVTGKGDCAATVPQTGASSSEGGAPTSTSAASTSTASTSPTSSSATGGTANSTTAVQSGVGGGKSGGTKSADNTTSNGDPAAASEGATEEGSEGPTTQNEPSDGEGGAKTTSTSNRTEPNAQSAAAPEQLGCGCRTVGTSRASGITGLVAVLGVLGAASFVRRGRRRLRQSV